jgi:Na+/H+ antiporter NhaD/arsenite permease-like protein
MPWWTVLPFALYLLAIAILPLAAPRFWHPNRNKLILALAASIPVAAYLLAAQERGGDWLLHSALDYAGFIAIMAALYVTAGGIHVRGSLAGTPLTNTVILGIGAAIASFIGTTGASMVLIRPLLRANRARLRKAHLVVFFIFIVSNAGGMLTPLGDPPLFLGFLHGVPFAWTFTLAVPWLLVNTALLTIFHFVDRRMFAREERVEEAIREPLRVEGGLNLVWLAGVIGVVYATGAWGRERLGSHTALVAQMAGLAALAGLSAATTRKELREANRFTWSPIFEVAAIFVGIFVTMVPALQILGSMGSQGKIAMSEPWQFFWGTGVLSSFLDNAPTYLTFAALAAGLKGVDPDRLGDLLAAPGGEALLAAISCGAVFFGAMTYIGNGPNFMVKAIAEENEVRMPGFFGYMAWSGAILLPLFVLLTFAWF